jgi:hypothetical protein
MMQRRRVAAALVIGTLAFGGATTAAGADGGSTPSRHCADHTKATKVEGSGTVWVRDTTTGQLIEVQVTVDGSEVVFTSPDHELTDASFCLKGGPASTGPLGGTSGDTSSIPNGGGQVPDISYVVLYSVSTGGDQPCVAFTEPGCLPG